MSGVEKVYSDSKITSFKYEWKIEYNLPFVLTATNQSSGKDPVERSPGFLLDDDDKWCLGLFFSIRNNENKRDYKYELGLWRECEWCDINKRKKRLQIQCKVVIDSTKAESDEISIFREVESNNDEHNPVILDSGLFRNIHKFTLNVTCYFHIEKEASAFPIINDPISKITGRNLSIDFAKLFNNKKLTDITFILGDKTIQAHKVILISRCHVFEAMFSNPMKEQNDDEVVIDDIDYEVFEEMLRYIYTDEVSDLNDISVTQLLYAADKYGLEDLKEECGASLGEKITIDNAAETFINADRYNLKELSTQTRFFIRRHLEDFLNSSGYDNMVDKYPKLAKKVFKSEKE